MAFKIWIANAFLSHEMTVREIFEKYKIPVATIYKYIKIVKAGGQMTADTSGQPR